MVVATGPFQLPFTPPVAAELPPDVHQLHSADYRRPEQLPPGRVLVVGAANSGCQIALELSATRTRGPVGRHSASPTVPQRPLGRDVWWWASGLRLDRVTADSRLGRRLAGRDQIVGAGPRQLARRHGITLRPRVDAVAGRDVIFADGAHGRVRRRRLGDRVHHGRLVDRRPGRHRRARAAAAVARSHPLRRALHARPELAAHPGLGAARLGGRRRGLPRRADRIASKMSGQP